MSETGNGPSDPYGGTQPPPGWTPAQPGQQQGGWGSPPPGYGTPPPGYGTPPPGYGTPPGYGGPPGFGTPPGYGYAVAPPTEGKATGALIAAILSWAVCPFVPAIVALVLAGQAKRNIEASMGRLGGTGMVTAARIVAWVNIAFSIIVGAFFIIAISASSGVDDTSFQYNSTICEETPYYSPPPGAC